MSKVSQEVGERIKQIEREIISQEAAARGEPDGRLRISKGLNAPRYYAVQRGQEIGVYIKKDELTKAKELAQKDYRGKVLRSLKQEKKLLENLAAFYFGSAGSKAEGKAHGGSVGRGGLSEDFYYGPEELIRGNLTKERRDLTTPIVQDEEDFVSEWMAKEYERKPFREGAPEYYSNDSVQMRSKSEVIIAGILEKYGVPYHYEMPLRLEGVGTIYPDFTVLNVKTRTTMYWEHMGMMDNPEYQDKALERIHLYERAGLFPGIELILTHETSTRPLQTRVIERVIEKYLL